ncbi:MAG: hypothetical protein LBO82_04720 [Synergistaceae bacterium]|jgi:hypothetical protein|nr:hypothetical protein [Synergistaceae bacterium]
MTNVTVAPAVRGTQREILSVPVTPVDEKRFESEIRRIETAGSEEKKGREKFETRIEKAVNDLRGEMKDLRSEMYVRFEKTDDEIKGLRGEVNARFEKLNDKIDGNLKATVTMQLTTMGILLAAFYAFASYMTK